MIFQYKKPKPRVREGDIQQYDHFALLPIFGRTRGEWLKRVRYLRVASDYAHLPIPNGKRRDIHPTLVQWETRFVDEEPFDHEDPEWSLYTNLTSGPDAA